MMTKLPLNWLVFTLTKEKYQKSVPYFKQIDTISPDFWRYEYGYSQPCYETSGGRGLQVAKKGWENYLRLRLLLAASKFSYELAFILVLVSVSPTAKGCDAEDTVLNFPSPTTTIIWNKSGKEDITPCQEPENLLWLDGWLHVLTRKWDRIRAYELYQNYRSTSRIILSFWAV